MRSIERQPPVAPVGHVEMTAQRLLPSGTEAAVLFARNLEQQNQVDEAEKIYQQLLTEQGDIKTVLHRLAVINGEKGNFEVAETHFRKVLSMDPENAELLCDFGFNCFLQNRMLEAEQSYLSAININPDLKRLHNNLAVLYARTDRNDLAYRQFCASGCDPVTARENLMSANVNQNKPLPMIVDPQHVMPHPDHPGSAQPNSSVPTINFSSPPLQHIPNPSISNQLPRPMKGPQAADSTEITHVVYLEDADESAITEEVENRQAPFKTSSRRNKTQ